MVARFPVVGSDINNWGTILNNLLHVGHNNNGTTLSTLPIYNPSDDAYGNADPTGVNDSTTAINNAITQCGSTTGGIVGLGPGRFRITNTLNDTFDNVRLIGCGRATIIDADAAFPAAPMVWYHAPASNFRLGCAVENLLIRNINGATGVTGLQLDSTYWARVSHVDFEDVFATNIFLNGSGSFFGAYTQIDHCHLGPVPGGALSAGTGILTNNHEFSTIRDCTFNWFKTAGGVGIKLNNGSNLIQGCTFDENDTSIWNVFQSHNIIDGNQFDRGVTQFIYLNGCKNTKVVNNSFQGFVGVGSKSMINVDTGSNASNVIDSNTAKAGTSWNAFVTESAGAGTPGNTYSNNDVASLSIVRLSGIFRGNRGYNPVGPVTAPGIPASGTPLVNPFGVDATVQVQGGTVSGIDIGGAGTIGVVPGFYQVPALQSITLHYTVAPSWGWWLN